ncbi:phage major capsid protein [Pelagimonas varians]|uniref:Phage capsid family protein n=1 Tax=Pelagimonas varians TaxID=696760 RepID=A0A238K6W8_9RHOB|nr:phage major capsid protein [Pelagimonas varians]PYG30361.1 HK97 family phage major capsid protein [Pelagimonas varians]SMX37852.1 Phage capsid family protein [Pelagimonas varians]
MTLDKAHELREQRAAKTAEMRAINDKADTENRDLSGEEQKRFNTLEGEARSLQTRLTNAEKLAEFERFEARGEDVSGNGSGTLTTTGYSLSKALTESRSGRLTGLEAEHHQELARDRGEVRGVMVPTEIILGGETRALTTGGTGGNLVATNLAAMTDRRRPALKIESMGATVLRGLSGNLELPRLAGSGSASWVAEHTDANRSDATFSKTSMGPKTVTAEYELSRRMMLQSNTALETVLRADLAFLLAQKLDSAAIRGGGTNEPTGILANGDVSSVTGGPIDADLASDLIAALESDNVSGTAAFLTNPAVMNLARKLQDSDGRNIPLSETFHNERVESSTQVPSDIGAGSDKDALIYGEWASLYIGYWSGVDLLVNPYHSDVASKGGALLHAFLDADVVVRHPEGFRYAEIG